MAKVYSLEKHLFWLGGRGGTVFSLGWLVGWPHAWHQPDLDQALLLALIGRQLGVAGWLKFGGFRLA